MVEKQDVEVWFGRFIIDGRPFLSMVTYLHVRTGWEFLNQLSCCEIFKVSVARWIGLLGSIVDIACYVLGVCCIGMLDTNEQSFTSEVRIFFKQFLRYFPHVIGSDVHLLTVIVFLMNKN